MSRDRDVCPLMHVPTALTGWEHATVIRWDVVVMTHLVPCGDLRRHQLDPTCWCGPVEVDDAVDFWAHNSADGREAYEQGARRHN